MEIFLEDSLVIEGMTLIKFMYSILKLCLLMLLTFFLDFICLLDSLGFKLVLPFFILFPYSITITLLKINCFLFQKFNLLLNLKYLISLLEAT